MASSSELSVKTQQCLPPSLPLVVPGMLPPHLELVPLLLHRHPHVGGEDAVEDADDAALMLSGEYF